MLPIKKYKDISICIHQINAVRLGCVYLPPYSYFYVHKIEVREYFDCFQPEVHL